MHSDTAPLTCTACESDPTYNISATLLDACEFSTSMLLVFILVYVFHGFQSHAAPLTSLLAELQSRDSTTVLSTPACICPAS